MQKKGVKYAVQLHGLHMTCVLYNESFLNLKPYFIYNYIFYLILIYYLHREERLMLYIRTYI